MLKLGTCVHFLMKVKQTTNRETITTTHITVPKTYENSPKNL